MNIDIHNALEQSLAELAVSAAPEMYGDILELCQRLKFEVVICQLNPTQVQETLWTSIRTNKRLMLTILSCASTFILNQAEYESNLELLAKSISTVSEDSIVDVDFRDGCINVDEALDMLTADGWLYWLITLSLNLRFVADVSKPVKGGYNVS